MDWGGGGLGQGYLRLCMQFGCPGSTETQQKQLQQPRTTLAVKKCRDWAYLWAGRGWDAC